MPHLQSPDPSNPLNQEWKNHAVVWAENRSAIAAALPGVAAVNASYGDDEMQRVDIYQPPKPRGIVIWFHPGGWQFGTKTSQESVTLAVDMVANGFVFATANYRLVPEHQWPDQGQDVTAVIGFVRDQHPDLPFCLAGASAGALLATWGSQGGASAAAGWFGVYDLNIIDGRTEPFFQPFVGSPGDPRRSQVSPVNHVAAAAPTLLVRDPHDVLVPATHTTGYKAALDGAGKPCPVYEAPYGGHGVGVPAAVFVAAYVQRTVEWFLDHT